MDNDRKIIGYEDHVLLKKDGSMEVVSHGPVYATESSAHLQALQDAVTHGTGIIHYKAGAAGVSLTPVGVDAWFKNFMRHGPVLYWAWGTTWSEARAKDAQPYVIDQPLLDIMSLVASPLAWRMGRMLDDWAIRHGRLMLALYRRTT